LFDKGDASYYFFVILLPEPAAVLTRNIKLFLLIPKHMCLCLLIIVMILRWPDCQLIFSNCCIYRSAKFYAKKIE